MRYGKVVVVLLVLGLLTEACSLTTDRTGGTGGDTESTRVAMEATLTAMESTVAALTPTQQTETPAQPAETPTQQTVAPTQLAVIPTQPAVALTQAAAPPTQAAAPPTQAAAPPTQVAAPPTQQTVAPSPTAQSVVPTPQSVVPTPTPTATPKAGPTDEDLARKQLLEIQFAQNPRYPSEQIYVNNIPVFMYRVPNDLTDLGTFLGYKVTPAQRDALFSYPFYGSAKEIEGELFRWIWREGAVDYLKSQGAKPYWWMP